MPKGKNHKRSARKTGANSEIRMTPFPLFWHGKQNMMQNGVCCNNATAPHLLLISMCHRMILEPVISFASCQLTMIKSMHISNSPE